MRTIKAIVAASGLVASMLILGEVSSVRAQETTIKKTANKVVRGTKKGYSKGRRVGHTVGNRTWNGTKWVYRKGKKGVSSTKKRVS